MRTAKDNNMLHFHATQLRLNGLFQTSPDVKVPGLLRDFPSVRLATECWLNRILSVVAGRSFSVFLSVYLSPPSPLQAPQPRSPRSIT